MVNSDYHKQYYIKNKNKIMEQSTNYYINNKEKVNEYQKIYKKDYYQKNKESFKIKIDCPCGGRYTKDNKYNHCSTLKHRRYLNKAPNTK